MNPQDEFLPRWLRVHPDVSIFAANVWSHLAMRQGRNATAWPNVDSIARDLKISRNTVKRAIADLERLSLLTVERVNGRGNRYRPLTPTDPDTGPSQGSVASESGPSQGSVASESGPSQGSVASESGPSQGSVDGTQPSQGSVDGTQPSQGRHRALTGPAPGPHRAGTGPSQGSVTLNKNPYQEPFQGTAPRAPAPAKAEAPSVVHQVAELETALDAELCADARAACALSRRNGKMADTVWLTTLRQLSAYPPTVANEAMRTFAARYADGEKDERYLVGIARGLAKSGRPGVAAGRQGGRIPAPPNSVHGEPDDPDDFDFSGARRRRVHARTDDRESRSAAPERSIA